MTAKHGDRPDGRGSSAGPDGSSIWPTGTPEKGNLVHRLPFVFATAMRGVARLCLGIRAGRTTCAKSIAMGRAFDPFTLQVADHFYAYTLTIPYGVLLPDAIALRDTAEALEMAEQSGETPGRVWCSGRTGRCSAIGAARTVNLAFELLTTTREQVRERSIRVIGLPFVDTYRTGDGATSAISMVLLN